jgi:methionyl-tRNA formyltransferase
LNLIFAGTPDFACTALAHLHAAGHRIALVLTQPDRPAGRGMKMQASPVKQFALAHGMALAQPHSLRLDGAHAQEAQAAQQAITHAITEDGATAMVVAAYGLILPQWVLQSMAGPGLWGCLNIHGSVLPRWRGAAPIHRAIEAGDSHSGVTLMQMDAGLDTGAMLDQKSIAIAATDTTASLHDRVATLGAKMMVQALAQPQAMHATAQPQDGITYAHKIEKSEAAIDWQRSATQIARQVRAFDPFPVAQADFQGETFKVWAAQELSSLEVTALAWVAGVRPAPAGHVLAVSDEGIVVACGEGMLRLTQLQRPGSKRMPAADFLRGCNVAVGSHFTQGNPR